MCGMRFREKNRKPIADPPYEIVERPPLTTPTYSHIFRQNPRQEVLQWVLRLNRLSEDPFYEMMHTTNDASRWWMFRNTPWHLDQAHLLNGGTILRYFENMGRDGALRYFRARRAPMDIIRTWEAAYPAPPPAPLNEADEEEDDN